MLQRSRRGPKPDETGGRSWSEILFWCDPQQTLVRGDPELSLPVLGISRSTSRYSRRVFHGGEEAHPSRSKRSLAERRTRAEREVGHPHVISSRSGGAGRDVRFGKAP
jgi:hypothetical protein